MPDSSNKNYLQVGYDNLLQRGDNMAFHLGDTTSPDASLANMTAPASSIAPGASGAVETMPVKDDGGIGDIWIKNFIKSENWLPKKVGFYIDGKKGYAEFSDVYVSGNIQALTGTIGGFTINATNLSITAGGNTVILSSGATAFTAGPTGAPAVTITQAGVLTATGAVITGTITASAGVIGGFTLAATTLTATSGGNTTILSSGTTAFSAGPTGIPIVTITQAGVLTATGVIITGTVSGRSTDTIASAISALGNFIDANLDTAAKNILASFTFGASGALQIGTFSAGISGDIKISPNGIVARNSAGANTFTLDGTTGAATFAGTLSAAGGTFGTITAGTLTGVSITTISGAIGGWTLAANSLSAVSGGNTTILSSGATAFSAGPTGVPIVTITQAGILTATGVVITGTISGRSTSVIAAAIDANGHFADTAINTATSTIITPFIFGVSGALQIGTYVNGVSGDVKISPAGILGRDQTGATTFSIDGTTGVAVLNGLVVGTNVGLGTAQNSAGVTTIINNTVTTGYVNALSVIAGSVAAENITGTYITGKVIRTAASGARVQLDNTNYLQAYDINYLRVQIDTTSIKFYNSVTGVLTGSIIGTINGLDLPNLWPSGNWDIGGEFVNKLAGDWVVGDFLRPATTGLQNLGTSSYKFGNLYLSGIAFLSGKVQLPVGINLF